MAKNTLPFSLLDFSPLYDCFGRCFFFFFRDVQATDFPLKPPSVVPPRAVSISTNGCRRNSWSSMKCGVTSQLRARIINEGKRWIAALTNALHQPSHGPIVIPAVPVEPNC